MKYRKIGIEYLQKFIVMLKAWKYLIILLPRILMYIALVIGGIICLFQIVDGKESLQIWDMNKLEKNVYELCYSRSDKLIDGAFIPIGTTYPENIAEEKTEKAIEKFNEEVKQYKEKRKNGEVTKRDYLHEKEAEAYWCENPEGEYGILINWKGDKIPQKYEIKSLIINKK